MTSGTSANALTAEATTTLYPQTSFASLPRELRDKIYHLVLPHSRLIKLTVNLVIDTNDEMDKLAERLGLLHDCNSLKEVKVTLHGGHNLLELNLIRIHEGFKALNSKLGPRLTFIKYVDLRAFSEEYDTHEMYVGDLDDLKKMARGDDSNRGFEEDVEEYNDR
ncbi:MAG: hypothetical protein Q9209_007182 [Squamulea sp. 1 TL-2023]